MISERDAADCLGPFPFAHCSDAPDPLEILRNGDRVDIGMVGVAQALRLLALIYGESLGILRRR
jgi:hypothetical protein